MVSPLLGSSYSLLTVRTVKSGRKMHCPKVSQVTWTISDNVGEYIVNTEKSPRNELSLHMMVKAVDLSLLHY